MHIGVVIKSAWLCCVALPPDTDYCNFDALAYCLPNCFSADFQYRKWMICCISQLPANLVLLMLLILFRDIYYLCTCLWEEKKHILIVIFRKKLCMSWRVNSSQASACQLSLGATEPDLRQRLTCGRCLTSALRPQSMFYSEAPPLDLSSCPRFLLHSEAMHCCGFSEPRGNKWGIDIQHGFTFQNQKAFPRFCEHPYHNTSPSTVVTVG